MLIVYCQSSCLSHQPGPIVRINPRELHIKEPLFYDTIYPAQHTNTTVPNGLI